MLGFVSALSATLAIIVLIASVMLVNLLSVSLERSNQNFHVKISGISKNELEGNGAGNESDKPNASGGWEHSNSKLMISRYVISSKDLPSLQSNISRIETGCSYGNNFSYDVALKLVSLNYIILAKRYAASDVKVSIQKPNYDENGINDCWVNTKTRE